MLLVYCGMVEAGVFLPVVPATEPPNDLFV